MVFDPIRRVSAADIAGATVLAVTSIDAPSELNSRIGGTNGALVLVTQNVAGINEWTIYAFDATSSGSVNSPYVLAASGSGQWIAWAGKYANGSMSRASALTVLGKTVLSATSAQSGASVTIASTNTGSSVTTEYGVFIDWRSDSSATANSRGAFIRAGTSASAYSTAVCSGLVVGNSIQGSGSTITAGYGIQITPQSTAANNYGLTHSGGTPNTGNYFIYDDAGYASRVSGVWTYTDTTDATAIGTASVVLSGGLGVAKRLCLDGASGKTLRITNGVANASVAVTLGSTGPTGSTAGAPQGWMRVDINGTDRYIPFW